ncbi:hypothetical protein NHX12_001210 [Muraenolepis orangiensis]|uniref:Asteroid domain-containing protein n=1 Tax=Muraenolepis orangiensis TaxID=630683 RepID=A0A9Q0E209_9TELE|nr:hypothetical protein NHX12_001210 [Muraenolepis orangiensis]
MGLEQNHGGQYLAFQTYVQSFFTTLKECGIKPYVVVDGGSGTNNNKQETILNRGRDKVRRAHSAAQTGKTEDILPVLSQLVFQQTLIVMAVPLVKCLGEADCELAALASEWRCPVLSKDSDFYIFDLPAGFLPLHHFQWDRANSFIPCKRYTTSRFCSFFNINNQLLPAFASLAGNDYKQHLSNTIKWEYYVPKGRETLEYNLRRLEGLLNLLRPEVTRYALTAPMPNADRTVRLKVCLETLGVNQETLEGVPPHLRLPVAVTCYWLRRAKPDLKLLKALLMADRTVRLKVCLETLGVNQETLEGVPPHLRLPVAVTCYWLRRAKPDLKLLKALLMVMIQGELNRQKGLTTGDWLSSIDLKDTCLHIPNQWPSTG